jgi:cytochrome c2
MPDPAIQAGINKAKTAGATPQVAALASQFGAYAAAGGTADATTIPLWRANHKQTVRRIGPDGEQVVGSVSKVTTPEQFVANDASTQFGVLLMDPAKMHEWGDLAWKAGLVTADNRNDANALGKAWDIAIGWAVNIKDASKGTTEVTPFEAAKMVAQNTGSALLAQQADAAAHFTGNKTTTSTTINQDANSQTGDVLHQLLGRNPTAGEKATYQHGLNQVAAANPTTTNSVNTYKDGQQTGQVNTVTGGYDEKAAAIQEASSASPDVARNQAATTYYQALVNAIGAAV